MFQIFKKQSRFVNKVRYFHKPLQLGKKITSFNRDEDEVYQLIQNITQTLVTFDYIKRIHETLYLEMHRYEGVKLLIHFDYGTITIEDTFNKDSFPTMRAKLHKENLVYLLQYLEKGYLTDEEKQRLMHFAAIPVVESFYYSKLLNKLDDISFLKIHNIMHIQLLNPSNFELRDGSIIDTKVTVLNVDGQFIILPGHVGTAPVLFKVTPDQAIEYYFLLNQQFPQAKTLHEKQALYKQYLSLRDQTMFTNSLYI